MPLYYQYARKALWLFLIYLPFAGTFSYAIDGNNPLFQLTKDIFYIPALIALIIYCQQEKLPILIAKKLQLPLLLLLGSSLLTFFLLNCSLLLDSEFAEPAIPIGIIGLKVLFGYIPLIFCAYYLIRNKQELRFLTRLQVILVLICCTLSLIQYLFFYQGLCIVNSGMTGGALYPEEIKYHCLIGGDILYNLKIKLIRLAGTFATPWQWGWFLISNAFFTVASAVSETSQKWRNTNFVAMGFLLATSLLSGQRIVLLIVATAFVILLFTNAPPGKIKHWTIINFGLIFLLILILKLTFFSLKSHATTDNFLVEQFVWVIGQGITLLGNGLGIATNAARVFGETSLIESYYPKLLYEIGVLGLLAFLVVVSTLTFLTFKAYRSVKDSRLHRLGNCIWVFVLFISYNPFYYPLDVDPVAVYYWFFAGVLLKLPQLEQNG